MWAALRAPYIFLARDESKPQDVVVTFSTFEAGKLPGYLLGGFANELVDQQLHQDLQMEFGRVHELIVAQALDAGEEPATSFRRRPAPPPIRKFISQSDTHRLVSRLRNDLRPGAPDSIRHRVGSCCGEFGAPPSES